MRFSGDAFFGSSVDNKEGIYAFYCFLFFNNNINNNNNNNNEYQSGGVSVQTLSQRAMRFQKTNLCQCSVDNKEKRSKYNVKLI